MEPLRVYAFSLVDGSPLGRVPYTDVSWTDTLCESGQMSVRVDWSEAAALRDLRQTLRPWRVAVAAIRGREVVYAGPVTRRNWDGRRLTLSCGSGWTLLTKRLVLNHDLTRPWFPLGELLIDEDNPAAQWVLTLTGSLVDIAAGLVGEALRWGPLPIDVPVPTGGSHTRTYNGWDLARTADRITDLTRVEGGPEIEFRPYLSGGSLRWEMRGADELVAATWSWSTTIPGQRVQLAGVDEDGTDMATEAIGLGGRSDDLVLVGRRYSSVLTNAGWPVMQSANTSHQSVTRLDTLQAILGEDVARGSRDQESIELRVDAGYRVRPGDHADVRVEDPYLGRTVLPLKVVETSGDTTEWLTVRCRRREGA